MCITAFVWIFFTIDTAYLMTGTGGNLVVTPINTIAVVGKTARFNCSTESATHTSDTVYWLADSSTTIVSNPTCKSTTGYTGILSGSRCDLEVVDVSTSTPSTFTCSDDLDNLAAVIITLDSEPTCVPDVNRSPPELVCSGTFHASANIPSYVWFACAGIGEGVHTTYTGVNSGDACNLPPTSFQLPSVTDPSYIPSFQCSVHFDLTDALSPCFTCARNIAEYNFMSTPFGDPPTTRRPSDVVAVAKQRRKKRCGRVDSETTCVCKRFKTRKVRCIRP